MNGPKDELPGLSNKREDGSLRSRVEMEGEIRQVLKSAQAKRTKAILEYGLPQKDGLSMKPITLLHWLLDVMVQRGEIVGEQLGVRPSDDYDPKSEQEFVQRLSAFVQAGWAMDPKPGEGVTMSNAPYSPPPPPPMSGNGASGPPGYAPPPQQGYAPPGPPPGYAPPPQQMAQAPQGYVPPPPPGAYQPPAPPSGGFASPPGQSAAPQAQPPANTGDGQGAPAPQTARRARKTTPAPQPGAPGAPPPMQMGQQPQMPPQAAPQGPPPSFGMPPQAPQGYGAPQAPMGPPPGFSAPPQMAPQSAPAMQQGGGDSGKILSDLESVRSELKALKSEIAGITGIVKATQGSLSHIEWALVLFLRQQSGKQGGLDVASWLREAGVQLPS